MPLFKCNDCTSEIFIKVCNIDVQTSPVNIVLETQTQYLCIGCGNLYDLTDAGTDIDLIKKIPSYFSGYNGEVKQTFIKASTIYFTATKTDSLFTVVKSRSGTEITINKNCWCRAGYDVSLQSYNPKHSKSKSHSKKTTISQVWLEKNGSTINGTHSYGYHGKEPDSKDTNSCVPIDLNLQSGDVLRVRANRYSGSATLVTVPNACRFNIEFIALT